MNKEKFIYELKKININITEKQLKQLDEYYQLLVEWNKVMNLTGITEKEDVYLKHFYDSLTIYRIIDLNNYKTLCDVGTGAGFPGLVIKIVFPHLKITLVDSLNKRITFLKEVIKQLGLDNIETINSRAEEFKTKEKFDIVTVRAVSKLNILLEYCIPLLKTNGYFIPLKGKIIDEIEYSQNALRELKAIIVNQVEFLLPIENSQRTLIKILKQNHNPKYPRKNSEIMKNPL